MHELELGQSIVNAVLLEVQKATPFAKVLKATIVVGKMRQVMPDYLKFAYQTLSEGTAIEGSQLEIRFTPILCTCSQCGKKNEIPAKGFICPFCKSSTGKISGGRELYLESLEVLEDE